MADVIGSVSQNVHTMTLDGLDKLVESETLLASIKAPLNMKLLHNRAYYDEPVPVGEGQKFIVTKEGMPDARQDPTAPPPQTHGGPGLDDGLTPIDPAYEQFSIKMEAYRDTIDYRMRNSKVSNLNKITSRVRTLTNKLARTMNLAYRRPMTLAAVFGHAYITVAQGSGPITTAAISNLSGFEKLWVAGEETAVSGTNTIRCTIVSGGEELLIDITGVAVDTRNDAADTTPGTITFTVVASNGTSGGNTITSLAEGDPITSFHASVVNRPNAKSSSFALGASDNLVLDNVINQAASMLSNGVDPDYETNRILAFGDFFAWASLMKDPAFRQIYRDRYASEEFTGGAVIDVLGCRLMFGHDIANRTRDDGLRVRRLVFAGAEACARGVYEQADPRGGEYGEYDSPYIEIGNQHDIMFDPDSQMKTVIRKPLNREADVISITMCAIFGTAANPDVLSNFGENPNSAYKRLGTVEFIA